MAEGADQQGTSRRRADVSDALARELHEVDYLIDCLRIASDQQRKPTEDHVVASFEALLSLYHRGGEAVRFRVIGGIAGLGYGDYASLLFEALRYDPSALVRHEAAFALAQDESSNAVQVLVEIGLNDASHLVRHEAAMALEQLDGEGAALPALEVGLADPSPEVVASCQVAIGSIRHRAKARKSLIGRVEKEMVKKAEIRDRFHKPQAGEPPYYMDDITVLFIDLVSFSSLRVSESMSSQVRLLQDTLHSVLDPHYYWDETHLERPNRVIVIPTGDGYAIAFHPSVDRRETLTHLEEIYQKLVLTAKMRVRFGLSRGPHYLFVDLNRILNLVGEGIIRAQRAMMLAAPGQIFCTGEFASGIESELVGGGRLEQIEGTWRVKNEKPFQLFNYRNRKIGKPDDPDSAYRA